MIKLHSLILVALLFGASVAWSQSRIQMAVNFATGFPQGEFSDNVQNTGFGLSTEFYYRIHRSFLVGGTLGFLRYGNESREEPFSPTIPDVLVRVDTSNNVLLTHFVVRYQPGSDRRAFRPYAEGLIGLHYLWTQTSIHGNGSDQITSTNFSDTTLSAGAGAGAFVRLLRGGWNGSSSAFTLDLDVGMRYLYGGRARYLTEGSIIRSDDSVTYLVNRSRTDLLTLDTGIVFGF